MQSKFFFFAVTSLMLLLLSCSERDAGNSFDIEGRFMQTVSPDGAFTLFAADSLSGDKYTYVSSKQGALPENYEAEAYRIHINEETVLVNAETGEETLLSEEALPFHWPNQRISVKTAEEFSPLVKNYGEHVSYDQRLFPVYTAEKIRTYDYSMEEFVEAHSPAADNHYILYLFDEEFNRRYLNTLNEYAAHQEVRSDIFIDIRHEKRSRFSDFLKLSDEPVFLVLSKEGESLRTSDWENVHDFFQEEKGIGIPREGDTGWRELLNE